MDRCQNHPWGRKGMQHSLDIIHRISLWNEPWNLQRKLSALPIVTASHFLCLHGCAIITPSISVAPAGGETTESTGTAGCGSAIPKPGGSLGVALLEPWGSLTVAFRWPSGGYPLAINKPYRRLDVALGWPSGGRTQLSVINNGHSTNSKLAHLFTHCSGCVFCYCAGFAA